MNIDEEKALRLRRTQLQAELARINVLLEPNRPDPFGYPADKYSKWAPKSARGTNREQFYRDAENDFRNTDSNGNYITPPEEC